MLKTLTFEGFCDETLEVKHLFGVFCLGVAQNVPVSTREGEKHQKESRKYINLKK